jgi:hypothetical protein
MQKKSSIPARAFWLTVIAGMTTGMGNGSVFGAAMMCMLGRGKFDHWGGWFSTAYDPSTFTGFVDICMIGFGVAYVGILLIGLKMHDTVQSSAA